MKDAEILELLRANKYSKAAEKLYGYFPVIKKFILKNSGTKQDAEDIYQDALIILMRKAQESQFVLTSSLNTYLYSVCRFLWSDQLKRKSKKVEKDFEKVEGFIASDQISEDIKNESEFALAEKAVSSLGEKCRQLLRLFYFEKISMKEIALKLKFATEKVAKNQKYRCIEKAKENLNALKTISHE